MKKVDMDIIFFETDCIYCFYSDYETLCNLGKVLESVNLDPSWYETEALNVQSEKVLQPLINAYCDLMNIKPHWNKR
ncbi:hypothetical protein [Nostoc phage A1]|nr:hypothetical protein [Nostoc phage A1]